MSDEIISPKGKIQFAALTHLVKRKPESTEATVHTIRLEFEGTSDKGATFKEAIEKINPALLGKKHASKPGNYTVQASTKFDVTVYDKDGNKMSDVPMIAGGTASMIVTPYTGNALGGALNLAGVVLYEVDVFESTGESAEDRQIRIAAAIAELSKS